MFLTNRQVAGYVLYLDIDYLLNLGSRFLCLYAITLPLHCQNQVNTNQTVEH